MNRIKQLRASAGMKQAELAQKIKVSQAALSGYETGKFQADIETYQRIADIFGVTLDYLLCRQMPTSGRGIPIPVLGDVAAGIPIEAIEDILDYEEITPELAATGEFFALRIKGQSMEPRMREGDIVIVRKQEYADNGDTAVVLVNGDSATVKRIKKGPDGITLIPTNPMYDTMFYSKQEVEQLPVRIIGKVVELRAKF